MKLLLDFLPILLFFAAYQFYGIYVATAVIIVASIAQSAWQWFKHRRIEYLPLITTLLVVVLGGATLLAHSEVFIKWKPTVVDWLFAAVFLGSEWIGDKTLIERLMGHALKVPAAIWLRLNRGWAIFFIAMGVVNLYVAYNFATDTWVNFKLFGMLGLTLVFLVGQTLYLSRYLKVDTESEE